MHNSQPAAAVTTNCGPHFDGPRRSLFRKRQVRELSDDLPHPLWIEGTRQSKAKEQLPHAHPVAAVKLLITGKSVSAYVSHNTSSDQ
jgi:hypothetical protein